MQREEAIIQQHKRLTVADMRRANVPERFWNVKYGEIPEGLPYRDSVRSYLQRLPEMLDRGVGLYLWSDTNSTGKSSIAVLIVKHCLRLRRTAFFEESGRLKTALIETDEFEEHTSIEQRVRRVDLLALDDVGKEYRTESGYAEHVLESILRDRSQKLRTTVITSGLNPARIEGVYSSDLAAVLRETLVPINVTGYDWREEKEKELETLL